MTGTDILPIADHRPTIDVVCRGSDWDMGCQQGEHLSERIDFCAAMLRDLQPFRKQQPFWLPFPVYQRMAEKRAAQFLGNGLQTSYPGALERIRGIASGSSCRASTVFLINAMEAVLSDIRTMTTMPSPAACSALAVSPEMTASRTPILAHNFDYMPLVQPGYSIRECHPTNGFRSLEFTAAPLGGAIDGLNEAGLCISYNYAYAIDRPLSAPTISMRISEALSRFRTCRDAADHFLSQSHWGGGLLMLADATGDLAAVELSQQSGSIRMRSEETPFLTHTNQYQCPEMRSAELPSDVTYTPRAPEALRGKRVHASAERRCDRLRELMKGRSGLQFEDLETIMSDHGTDDQPSGSTICMHSGYFSTTACIRMMPVERRMRISYSPACAAEFVELSLD